MGKKPEMGKWLLYQFFHKNKSVSKYLPKTKKYTHESFVSMLHQYDMVYVKPVAGSRGNGIIKVWLDSNGWITVKKTIESARRFREVKAATKFIDKLRNGKMYIVQQGIHMAKVNGRPFDIRVMMQRDKPGGVWRYSGMVAKIAGQGSVVTNTAMSKGRVEDVEEALHASFGWNRTKVADTVKQLQHLGLLWAKHFDTYQFYRELGFDVAIDTKGRIWLIEQNTAPSHALFAKNRGNLAPYRRIQYRWGVFEQARRRRKKGA